MIEFQLDGGGYGTFGDDTTITVAPKVVDKSAYEKQLEKQILRPTIQTRNANCSVISIERRLAGSARTLSIKVVRRSPAKSRRSRWLTNAYAAVRDSTCDGLARFPRTNSRQRP